MGQKIACTSRSGLCVTRVDRNKLDTLYYQLSDLISESGYAYQDVFARPKDVPSEKSIDWYSDLSGSVRQFDDLSDEEAKSVLNHINEIKTNLKNYSDKLYESGDSSGAGLLKNALVVPDNSCIYLVGGHPVITCWGFLKNEDNLAGGDELTSNLNQCLHDESEPELQAAIDNSSSNFSETDVVDMISEKYKTKLEEKETVKPQEDIKAPTKKNVKRSSVKKTVRKTVRKTKMSAEVAASTTKEPVSYDDETEKEKQEESQNVKDHESKKGKWWLYLLILFCVLLLLLLLYLLFSRISMSGNHDVNQPDYSFLKGTTRVKDALENEEGHLVDLKLVFKDDSGVGETIIQTSFKSCRGEAHATMVANDKVRLNLSPLKCPNGDDYESFDLICDRNRTKCEGSAGDGSSWVVSPVVER